MPRVKFAIFKQLVDELKHYDLKEVAEAAGVSPVTLWNWVNWNVTCPQMRTFIPVAEAIGFEVVLKRQKASLKLVA